MIDKVVFKIGIDNWEVLALRQVDNGQNLMFYINGYPKIVHFQLTNNPKTNVYCVWNFFRRNETGKFFPRPTFFKQDNNTGLSIDPDNAKYHNKSQVRIAIDKGKPLDNFWEMIKYFRKFKEYVDLGKFDNNISLEEISGYIDSWENSDKFKLIERVAEEYTYDQLESLLNRCKVKSVEQFASNLCNEDFKEKDWQDFFEKNKWMLSTVSTRLIFQNGDESKLLREVTQGTPDNRNHGSSRADYVGYNKTLTFIELKKPQTRIFKASKDSTSRTNTWSFSNDFIDGVSQCLGQINSIEQNDAYDDSESELTYIKHSPKSIFVIGNLQYELSRDGITDRIRKTCIKTFESFRHNSKNVEIITYDELFERVKYIATQIKLLE